MSCVPGRVWTYDTYALRSCIWKGRRCFRGMSARAIQADGLGWIQSPSYLQFCIRSRPSLAW